MKLGAEKKGQVIALAVLLAVAAGLLWRNLMPAGTAPRLAPGATATTAAAPVGTAAGLARLDPTLHMEKLDQLRAIEYTGSGRDLFHLGPPPAPPVSAATAAIAARQAAMAAAPPPRPAGPPPPPPIPLQFYGYAQANGMPEKIFMKLGDETYVVSQGDTIAKRYVIESIGKASVRVRDLMTQSVQELPLQQG